MLVTAGLFSPPQGKDPPGQDKKISLGKLLTYGLSVCQDNFVRIVDQRELRNSLNEKPLFKHYDSYTSRHR